MPQRPSTLATAVRGVAHIVFTAGVRSARPAGEALVQATDYQGVLNTLAAARDAGFSGRFVYMTSIGVFTPSPSATLLNLLKRNTLVWRARLEPEIRASGLDYTIVRAGFLTNAPEGRTAIELGQDALPLAPRYRVARGDVAALLVASLSHPNASRVTCEIVSGSGPRHQDWNDLLGRLKPDVPQEAARH